MHCFKKTAILSLAALCMLSSLATACNGKDSSKETIPPSSEYVVPVPDSRVDSSVPGKISESEIGKKITFEKIDVTLEKVNELDKFANTGNRIFCCEMTITNNTDKGLPLSYLTHFSLDADGKITEIGRSAVANSQTVKQYNGQRDMVHKELAPGATEKFVLGVQAPAKWKSLELVYMPYKFYTNDEIKIKINESDISHISATTAK